MAGCGRSMLVAGGSGFIGSNICKEAIRVGFRVASVSKDGRPSHLKERWADEVDWIQADLRDENAFVTKVREADAIISCVGRFGVGNNNFVEEVNGDLNIGLAHLVHREAGNLSKFGYISAQQYSARFQKPLRSYYNSKLKTETIIQSLFPKNYLILRPNWVFGWRHIFGPIWFPTQLLGAPLEHVMQPIADYCAHTKWVVPPMPVDELAHVMVLGCTVGRDVSGILPTVRVRDVMEREAKGQPLNDWLRGELLQRMKDKKEYFEETSFVEKYGVLGYGKKHTEIALMRHREELNPAVYILHYNT